MDQLKIRSFSDLERLFPPKRYINNPILVHGGNGWKDSQINDPLIVPDIHNPGKVIMFFTGMAAPVATGRFSIGYASADIMDPYHWTEHPGNPVFEPSEKGHWDDWWIWATSCHIINHEYYLFYIGVSRKKNCSYKIGYATSSDGMHWTRGNKGKPILTPSKDEIHVAYPSLMHENNTWYMFYQWRDKNGPAGVRLAIHHDGTDWSEWKKQNIEILSRGTPGSFDDKYIEGQQILKFGSDYVLLYHAFNNSRWTEGLAYSRKIDVPFIKSQRNPVFTGNLSASASNPWDGVHVSTSYLYNINNCWYLFYQGTNSKEFYSFANWDIGMVEFLEPTFGERDN